MAIFKSFYPASGNYSGSITPKAVAKNVSGVTQTLRVRFIVDANKTTPYDNDKYTSGQSVSSETTFTGTSFSMTNTTYIYGILEVYLPDSGKWTPVDHYNDSWQTLNYY